MMEQLGIWGPQIPYFRQHGQKFPLENEGRARGPEWKVASQTFQRGKWKWRTTVNKFCDWNTSEGPAPLPCEWGAGGGQVWFG